MISPTVGQSWATKHLMRLLSYMSGFLFFLKVSLVERWTCLTLVAALKYFIIQRHIQDLMKHVSLKIQRQIYKKNFRLRNIADVKKHANF